MGGIRVRSLCTRKAILIGLAGHAIDTDRLHVERRGRCMLRTAFEEGANLTECFHGLPDDSTKPFPLKPGGKHSKIIMSSEWHAMS